jgi:hypothetical protein
MAKDEVPAIDSRRATKSRRGLHCVVATRIVELFARLDVLAVKIETGLRTVFSRKIETDANSRKALCRI